MDAMTLLERFGKQAEQVLANVRPVAESYADACHVLGLDIEDAENAILDMAQQYGGCVSCRFSRASQNADVYARQKGVLPVGIRGCALGLRQETCTAREPIIPAEALAKRG
jgi:hypothetical protein